jgi:hypothetical protein
MNRRTSRSFAYRTPPAEHHAEHERALVVFEEGHADDDGGRAPVLAREPFSNVERDTLPLAGGGATLSPAPL